MQTFWNWARTFHCRPRIYAEPTSLESLRALVGDINANRWKVRVIGCGHSPSSLAMSNEILISMKQFNRIIEIDQVNELVHCEAGLLLSTLNDTLPLYELSLPVQGSVSGITIAGAVSTATHGSGSIERSTNASRSVRHH
jgi:FAD/FMN-containing dehydrogenase